MDIKLEILEKPDKDWNKRVLENKGDIYQTTAYAQFQEECLGMKSIYLLVKENSKIIGQLVITHGPRFAKYLRNKSKKTYRLAEKHLKIYTFIRGPIIINKKKKKQIYSFILDYLENLGKKKAFMMQDISLPLNETEEIYKLFYKKGFYSDSWGTVVVDTTKSEEELWKDVSRSHRRSIRKGRKQELVVKEAKTKKDYNTAISIIRDMAKRNKIFAHSKNYYPTFFKILTENKMGKVLFIEKDGKGIATITLYLSGKKAIQTLIAHTDYSMKKGYYGVDFLEWHIIKWCHENGYETYDLAGIRPDSKEEKEAGLRYYKTKWGGEAIRYPYFSKNYSKTKKAVVNLLMKRKKKLVTRWK